MADKQKQAHVISSPSSLAKQKTSPVTRRPLNLCIVTQELFGWNEPGEASAALHGLAQQCAAMGETVTLVWIPPFGEKNRLDATQAEKLQDYFARNYLITLKILTGSLHLLPVFYSNDKASVAIYHYLKEENFDVVYFALEGGLGYYSLLAAEMGLFRPRPKIYVLAHAPLIWQAESDRYFLQNVPQVAVAHMEKYCAATADGLISPTEFMFRWLRQKEWALPAETCVIPDNRPFEWSGREEPHRLAERIPNELVFFSGPEFHRGLTLFCDVLDTLAKRPLPPITITLLGRFGRILGEHTGGMLIRRARRWPFDLRMLPRLTEHECLGYLKHRNCLAVIPNFAANAPLAVATCLEEGIPFVATDTGGTAELITTKDRKRCLAEPKVRALANKIESALGGPVRTASPIMTPAAKRQAWMDHHTALAARIDAEKKQPMKSVSSKKLPFISIIMVHHDRPQYLPQAIEAVERQDYPNYELILVDDGSALPESHAILDELEPRFKKKGWRILRKENRYLGAARNAGVRASKGERILFVDDDNALFDHAVSTFVKAMDHSRSDICTAFSKIFHEPFVPPDQKYGYIHYFPLGGSLDLALIHNSFGDANAMIRREVFDKIGFQIEDYGFTAQDWEFYTRATLAGLKVRIIPEPLYWYRSSAQAMYRSSHWYDNRQPILAAFRKHNFAGLEHFYHLVVGNFVDISETEGYNHNLNYSVSDERFLGLRKLEPNSDEAYELLAELAAAEGRSNTSVALLGHTQKPDFRKRVTETLSVPAPADQALAELGADFSTQATLDERRLKEFSVCSTTHSPPLCYVEGPDRFYLEARSDTPSVAVLRAACPAGTISVSSPVFLDQAVTAATEFIVLLTPTHADPVLAVRQAISAPADGSSGWCAVSRPYKVRNIESRLALPAAQPLNLVLGLRVKEGSSHKTTLGCFSHITLRRALGSENARRPRTGPPPNKLRARALTDSELRTAKLITKYPSALPLLLIPPNGEGMFLRPSPLGNVVANLPWIIPPFTRKVIGMVEIAHEEASPFEFAMAMSRPGEEFQWTDEEPTNVLAFSGWIRVEEKFELRELSMQLRELTRSHLSLNLAIRLPEGSQPSPSQAYWRKLVLAWDE
jgi:glycosyltransferase involved in cell wall biosynthesis